MKIRLTKETLGLPVGTVLQHETSRLDSAGSLSVGIATSYEEPYIWIPAGYWEEIPEPPEEDRLREQLSKVHAEIESYKIAQTLFQRRVERRNANIILLEGELSQAQARIKELEGAQKPPEPQYRMLEAGEIIWAGDEDSYSGWSCVVPEAVGTPLMEYNVGKFRRRVG